MHIALLPLDERPVNTALPRDIGSIAGANVALPPASALPDRRIPGDVTALGEWTRRQAEHADELIVCLDMLGYGGLIAARTTTDPLLDVLGRLRTVEEIHSQHPRLPIDAVSLVMRASDSYDPGEEPTYWADYGRELHRLGALLHRRLLAETGDSKTRTDGGTGSESLDTEIAELRTRIPAETLADFEHRRLRNHAVNLAAIDLLASRTLDTLLVTADDTAEYAGGSVEQIWLRHWGRAFGPAGTLLMYPGADEVGAVLVARALARTAGEPVRYRISCATAEGLRRIASYENAPVGMSAARQITAAGGVVVGADEDADVVLVLHAPDPGRHDWAGHRPTMDEPDHRAAAVETAGLVATEMSAGHRVALADVRYGNGGDPTLVDLLTERGLVLDLVAYGGWNTAGNTIGSVVGAASAAVIGQRRGSLDPVALRRVLLTRLLEDRWYQAGLRPEIEAARGSGGGAIITDAAEIERLAKQVSTYFASVLTQLGEPGWQVQHVTLPWQRTFEIGFGLSPASPRPDPATNGTTPHNNGAMS